MKLSKQDDLDNNGEDERREEEEEKEEEFSFVCGGANTSPIAAEDIFIDGQIRPVYPLFNRDLFFSGENLLDSLPTRPPVKKVFVETSEYGGHESPSSPDRKAVEVLPDVCRKSNSTGFSKIWRFKDFLGRSNSDGRDAFVFLNSGHEAAAATSSVAKGEEKKALKGKAKKGKTASLSAYEVYLRSKAKDEERRRSSYLPYRPELIGFFTNVNGGLTKNIHPF
ncbi:Protein of unknown function (DUF1645 [Striga hermonthica]|uniref:Uncharacterized protein n=1 Tax=Striga hermonthica TaxID=68872 RepID=A0A9N7RJT9_STRHE|nr:Protein of unknown function (DUF1645 [Striga hermonthica]